MVQKTFDCDYSLNLFEQHRLSVIESIAMVSHKHVIQEGKKLELDDIIAMSFIAGVQSTLDKEFGADCLVITSPEERKEKEKEKDAS